MNIKTAIVWFVGLLLGYAIGFEFGKFSELRWSTEQIASATKAAQDGLAVAERWKGVAKTWEESSNRFEQSFKSLEVSTNSCLTGYRSLIASVERSYGNLKVKK